MFKIKWQILILGVIMISLLSQPIQASLLGDILNFFGFGQETEIITPNGISIPIVSSSYPVIQDVQVTGVERYIFSDVKANIIDGNLIITARTNSSFLAGMKTIYESKTAISPTTCSQVKSYLGSQASKCSVDDKSDMLNCVEVTCEEAKQLLKKYSLSTTELSKDGRKLSDVDWTKDISISTRAEAGEYKLGASSIIVVTQDTFVGNGILTNVTAENNYTHLTISDANIKAYYPLGDNVSSVIIYDYSSNNNDLTFAKSGVAGSGYSAFGLYGNSFFFNKSILTADIPDWVGNYTVSLWYNTYNATQEMNVGLFSSNNSAIAGSMQISFGNQTGDVSTCGNKMMVSLTNLTGSTLICMGTISANTWTNIIATWNGTTAVTYQNGVLQSTVAVGGYVPAFSYYRLGTNRNSNKNYTGYIDDVIIWNKALSSTEITSLYNNQTARFYNTGTQELPNINISGVGTENMVNITIANCQTLLGTNLSAQIGIDNKNGYTYNGSIVNFTSCSAKELTVQGNPNNVSLKISQISNGYSFYSPMVMNNITLNSYLFKTCPVDINIDSCGYLNCSGSTYHLLNNIDSLTSNCFTINNNSVTLNLEGFSVKNTGGSGYGVVIDGVNQTTIKNGNITGFEYGAYIINNNNITIKSMILDGSAIRGTAEALHGENTQSLYVYNSYLNDYGGGSVVYLSQSNNSIISLSVINGSNNNYGINLIDSHYAYIFGINIYTSNHNIHTTDSKMTNVTSSYYNGAGTEDYVSNGELYRKWYVTFNVTNSTYGIENANVTWYDNAGNIKGSLLTSSDGTIPATETGYINNGTINLKYPFNVTTTHPYYYTNYSYFNLTYHITHTIFMEQKDYAPQFANITANQSYAIAGNYINFSTDVYDTDTTQVNNAWFSNNFDLTDNQTRNSSSSTTTITFGGSKKVGQTFRFSDDLYLREACINISYALTGTRGNILIDIYNVNQGTQIPIDGNLTFPITIPYGSFSLGQFYYICNNFSSPYKLSKDTYYAIVVSSPGSSSTSRWGIRRGANTYEGLFVTYSISWTSSTSDAVFSVTGGRYNWKNETIMDINSANAKASQVKQMLWGVDKKSMPSGFSYRWCANDTINFGSCSDIYNYYVAERQITNDNIAPNGSIVLPPNGTKINKVTKVRAIASDNYGVTNVSMEIMNSTMDWVDIIGCEDLTGAGIYDCLWDTSLYSDNEEGYEVRFVPCDIVGNCNYTIPTRHYYIDRTIPYAQDYVIYPSTQSSIRNTQRLLLRLNVTDEDSGIDSTAVFTDLTLLNGTGISNMLFSSGSVSANQNSFWNISVDLIGALDGNNYPDYYASDLAIPDNTLHGAYEVFVDNIIPTYSEYTQSDTLAYQYTNVTFSLKAYDNYLLSSYIFSNNFDGSWKNFSSLFTSENAVNISEMINTGNYSFFFIVYDDAGNSNMTELKNIEIIEAPTGIVVNLVSPDNYANYTESEISFIFNYTGSNADSCSLYLDDVQNQTLVSPLIDTNLEIKQYLPKGYYIWRVSCNNSAGVYYNSEDRELNIIYESIAPYFTYIPPTTEITYGQGFNVTFSATDDSHLPVNFAINWTDLFKIGVTDGRLENDTRLLPVGNYSINVTINDTVGNINSTIYYVIVSQATSSCSISVVPSATETYPTEINVSGRCNFDTYTLWRNGVNVSDENSLYIGLGAGNYNYSVNITEENENYTYSEALLEINILKKSPTASMSITGTTGYEFNPVRISDIGVSESNTGDDDCVYSVSRENATYGVGTWEFNYSTEGCQNYSAGSLIINLVITQNQSYCIPINFSPSWNVPLATETTVTGEGCPADFICNLSRDSVIVSNPDIQTLVGGDYNYAYGLLVAHQNYTESCATGLLRVGETIIPSAQLTFPCRYKKLGYYNLKLPWLRQENCL